MTVASKLAAILGADAVDATAAPPLARPQSLDAVAAVVGLAHEAGWRIRLQGTGSWVPTDAPADLAVTTSGLAQRIDVASADLVVTAEGGIELGVLDDRLADHGAWLPIDPPGSPHRTLGSAIATGTWGALRQGFGPLRDHLLGITAVIGDGSIVRAGGRVVKNVAGYDLSRAIAGSFGGFGIIAEAHLRLRIRPRVDRTWTVIAPRDDLFEAAATLARTSCRPLAMEILSPAAGGAPSWTLAVRLAGAPAAVEADMAIVRASVPGAAELSSAAAGLLWRDLRQGAARTPLTLRAGALPEGVEGALEDIERALGEGWITAGPLHGGLRWGGDAAPAALVDLRRRLAVQEIPLTLERAAWPVRSAVGHFGAYREGAAALARDLRRAFDPGERFMVPLEGQ
jgi:FAD/FMN-containing dehydrogenase